jgi:hypothetical protein
LLTIGAAVLDRALTEIPALKLGVFAPTNTTANVVSRGRKGHHLDAEMKRFLLKYTR